MMLLERDYKPKLIEAAIEKAKSIPRIEALKKVEVEQAQNLCIDASVEQR